MKKIIIYNVAIVLYYMLIVLIFDNQKMMFPVFMISTFFFSLLLSKTEVIYSFLLFYIIWIIHLFLPRTILSINIIYLLFVPLTLWFGYYLRNRYWLYKIIYSMFLILVGIYGFSNFLYYVINFNARQNVTSPKMELVYENNSKIRLDTVQNKIIVLDFWNTSCSVCFKKFPAYEEIYLKYKENPKVAMYAVNIPTSRDTSGKAERMIAKYNYTFPVLYADSDTIPKSLVFNGYPRLIILKDKKVRFNGYGVMGDKNVFVASMEDEIKLLLNEDK